jgi:hypothetical protein
MAADAETITDALSTTEHVEHWRKLKRWVEVYPDLEVEIFPIIGCLDAASNTVRSTCRLVSVEIPDLVILASLGRYPGLSSWIYRYVPKRPERCVAI